MSTIERAAKRLEELRNAGIEVPDGFAAGGTEASRAPGSALSASPAAARRAATRPVNREGSPFLPPETGTPGAPSITGPQRTSRQVDIDFNALRAGGFITPDASRTTLANQFRIIKRPLLDNAAGRGAAPVSRGNLIMVTSSLPKEGKTFVSINLAMSIAMEVDKTVLLVDGDVLAPSVLPALGLPPARGLTDLLVDPSCELSEVLLRTNVERLVLLPAGTAQERASELLASDSMAALIEDLAGRYPDRIIVFDSPPLLPTTEARVLATHMGQIVMVVRADRTSQGAVQESLAMLEQCPVVATLLNAASDTGIGQGYGYGYGYNATPDEQK